MKECGEKLWEVEFSGHRLPSTKSLRYGCVFILEGLLMGMQIVTSGDGPKSPVSTIWSMLFGLLCAGVLIGRGIFEELLDFLLSVRIRSVIMHARIESFSWSVSLNFL